MPSANDATHSLVLHTEEEEGSSAAKAASLANGFQCLLSNFDAYFKIVVSRHLFEITDRLSKALQHENCSVREGSELMRCTVRVLTSLRDDELFDTLYNEAQTLT